jgi:drug/metabolite transporter (DMT)-like permease
MTNTHEGSVFRYVIGLMAIVGGLGGLAGLYFVEIPPGNKEPLLLAIGLVLGWGSGVINSEYGATTTGRKVAESAVRQIERQTIASEAMGTEAEPLVVEGAPNGKPVNVKEKGK